MIIHDSYKYKIFLKKYFTILILFTFSSLCTASDISNEDLEEIYQHVATDQSQWTNVEYDKPDQFDSIFLNLPPSYWPALPESYEWRQCEDGIVELYKHNNAPKHTFDFVTYRVDDTKCNFLSRWDYVTRYSFAYTRKSPFNNDAIRNFYPMNGDAYKFNGRTYTRGHCIDFCDTARINNRVDLRDADNQYSTFDFRNYIPEPPRTHWGLSLRNRLVREIRERKANGCYAQYMYYDLMPFKTKDGTSIPDGIYFARIDANPQSYHIPWDHEIHDMRAGSTTWHNRLKFLESPENFFPSPYFHDRSVKIEEMDFAEVTKDDLLHPSTTSFYNKYRVTQAADHEICNVFGKTVLIDYQLRNNESTPTEIESWLSRLCHHAFFMAELGLRDFMPETATNSLLRNLKNHQDVDANQSTYDLLCQLYSDNFEAISVTHKEILAVTQQEPPIKKSYGKINSNDFEKPDKMFSPIINLIKSNDIVQINNLTTIRANKIAKHIENVFKDKQDLEKICIEYTVDSSKKWNIQGAFDAKGIHAKRVS